MFSDVEASHKCSACGYRIDLPKYNPSYNPKNSMQDFSITYDGFWIVSVKFRDFCIAQNYDDLEFEKFQSNNDYFNLKVNNVVVFDYEKRRTRFEKRCNLCGNFESIVGATPTYLLVKSPIKTGILRTDILFGSGNEKHSLVIV
jgi:hypothetical protein